MPETKIAAMIDGRCDCKRCTDRTENIYRMISDPCRNCGAGPFLLIYRAGDKSGEQDCPTCGNWHSVYANRLATADEIPAAVSS